MLPTFMMPGRLDFQVARRQLSNLCIGILSTAISIAAFASKPPTHGHQNVWHRSAELDELLIHGRAEFHHMEEVCGHDESSLACEQAKWRVHIAENAVTNHHAFPPHYRPSLIRQCLYAGVVACSILGGPDPAEQGITPWSVLSGQELTEPVEHFRKWASESGSKN